MVRGRFDRAALDRARGTELPDLLPAGELRLLIVGINPGLWTAAAQAHFARPGNRFWRAMYAGGVLPEPLDVSGGMSHVEAELVTSRGIGITNLVPVATARADELTRDELRAGGERLRSLVRSREPRVVAVLGKTAYAAAFGVRTVIAGRQPEPFEGAELWVLPNPSGLNAHDTVDTLAAAYQAAAEAASVEPGASAQ